MSLWQLAFRPFFLFGTLQAALAVARWLLFLNGLGPAPGFGDPIIWHAHEMLFGFASAIVVGFVLTASQNWTGLRGVHGWKLKLVFGLWALARLAYLWPLPSGAALAAVDLAFYPVAAILLVPYFRDPELKVERVFYVFFGLLFGGDLIVQLDWLGVWPGHARLGLRLALDTILLVIVFMGGRVIPFFTESSIAKSQPKTRRWVEIASHATAALFLAADVLAPESAVLRVAAAAAALAHFLRLAGWQVRRIRRIPLLWVLHLAYLWLVVGFALHAVPAPRNLATHAFTVGCVGILILGMVSRVSLGHTGRRLHPSVAIVVGYVLLSISALTRVLVPLVFPSAYQVELLVSGALWCAAFAIFVICYAPMLLTPRIDGRPG